MTDATTLDSAARRATLRRGLGSIAGIAILMITGTRIGHAQGKMAKSAVQYTDKGTVKGQDCDDCIHFIAGPSASGPATCKLVEGEISPHGHCLAFAPR